MRGWVFFAAGKRHPVRTVERVVERLSPSLSLRLRVLKKQLAHDMTLRVINHLAGSGRPDPGKTPEPTIQPPPVWI